MREHMYEWIKAFHVIAVIAWLAGLLYLPRLFVYHCAAGSGSVQSETFKTMERRLLRVIINPAMIVVALKPVSTCLELYLGSDLCIARRLAGVRLFRA
jgi:putative membrane protein